MSKKIYLAFSISLFLLASIIIYSSQIPNLDLSYKNTKIEALKCPFSWDTILRHKRWDYPPPEELAEKLNETVVNPEAKIDFNFSRKPESFQVSLWDEKTESYISDSKDIKAPKENGIYVFSVIGKWGTSQVLYVFKVRVE